MPEPVRVLLTGRHGQLGRALLAGPPAGIEVIATGRDELDLADAAACRAAVARHHPAEALAASGGRLLQVSTDFVFNGEQGHPYTPEQALAPLGVYGATKAEGERLAAAALPSDRLCLLRTSWVYGPVGANFCLTMLRLHRAKAAAGEPLGVVADQVGCPTATAGLAEACWRVIGRGVSGRHHWSDCGAASWYDFAVAIGERAAARGLIAAPARVRPITTADYPTPARRPAYSLLDATTTRRALDLEGQHWQSALAEVLAQVAAPPA